MIRFSKFAALHRDGELASCRLVLCDKNDPARFAVESVDERELSSAGKFVGTERFEPVKKRRGIPGDGRMDEKMRRFVDEEKVGILIDDFEVGRIEAQVDK